MSGAVVQIDIVTYPPMPGIPRRAPSAKYVFTSWLVRIGLTGLRTSRDLGA